MVLGLANLTVAVWPEFCLNGVLSCRSVDRSR